MNRRGLFILAHSMGHIKFYSLYKKVMQNQWRTYEDLKKEQELQLRRMINFCYDYVPFYHKLFKNLNIYPDIIKTIEDLEKLPILTKETVKKNWEDFKPTNLNKIDYYNRSTGGIYGNTIQI